MGKGPPDGGDDRQQNNEARAPRPQQEARRRAEGSRATRRAEGRATVGGAHLKGSTAEPVVIKIVRRLEEHKGLPPSAGGPGVETAPQALTN